jgi:hypothetical protein
MKWKKFVFGRDEKFGKISENLLFTFTDFSLLSSLLKKNHFKKLNQKIFLNFLSFLDYIKKAKKLTETRQEVTKE